MLGGTVKVIQKWVKHIAASIAVIALPLAVIAQDAASGAPDNCPPIPHAGNPMALPPFAMFPEAPPLGMMPPFLRDLKLTEAQQDKLFALMHEHIPKVREQMKAASKAVEELRRQASMGQFDADKARTLADAHGRAVAQMTLIHAELDAKVHALLTPEQRKQLDETRSKAEPFRGFKP
jgi:Spy/CpxP family protein refolding chaperone